MTTTAALIDTSLRMHEWVCSDATLLLACAGVWVDPFHAFCTDEEWHEEEYEMMPDLDIAWAVSRDYWLDIYADMNAMLFSDVPLADINRRITEAIHERLPSGSADYLADLTELACGYVPMPYYGNPLWSEDGIDAHHTLYALMDAVTLVEEDDVPPTIALDEMIDALKASAAQGTGIRHLWGWVNGTTGNSSCDNCWEEAAENGITSIEIDNLETGIEIAAEADEIMGSIYAVAEQFETDAEFCRQFCENAILAYCAGVQEVFHAQTITVPTIQWRGDSEQGADGGTVIDLEVHALRDRAVA